MQPLHALILGIVEGITEFLPISSTGHLILASELLRIPDSAFLASFEIAIQLGAILAVVVLYWRKLLDIGGVGLKLLAAFIPTAIIGLLLHDVVKTYLLSSTFTVLWSLLLGGIALVVFERFHTEKKTAVADIRDISYTQAVLIGLCQSVAIIPGVSRAAATIVGGLLLGLTRTVVVEFSFLLAVPTMAAATGLDLLKSGMTFKGQEWLMLGIGFVTAFVVAMASIKWLLTFIKTNTFTPFGVYRIAVAVVMLWVVM